jgi:hypothetical protein
MERHPTILHYPRATILTTIQQNLQTCQWDRKVNKLVSKYANLMYYRSDFKAEG